MMEIPLTREQFTRAQKLGLGYGIQLTDDEGTVTESGVTALYKYADGQLTVTILHKPFFLSTEWCEDQGSSRFRSI